MSFDPEFHPFCDLFPELQCDIILQKCDAATQFSFFRTCRDYWYGNAAKGKLPNNGAHKRPPSTVARAVARHGYAGLAEFLRVHMPWGLPRTIEVWTTMLVHGTQGALGHWIKEPSFHILLNHVYSSAIPRLAGMRRMQGVLDIAGTASYKLLQSPSHFALLLKRYQTPEQQTLAFMACILHPKVDEIFRPLDKGGAPASEYAKYFPDLIHLDLLVTAVIIGRPEIFERIVPSVQPLLDKGSVSLDLANIDPTGASRQWLLARGAAERPAGRCCKINHDMLSARLAVVLRDDRISPLLFCARLTGAMGPIFPPTSAQFGALLDAAMAKVHTPRDFVTIDRPRAFLMKYAVFARVQDRAEYTSVAVDLYLKRVEAILQTSAERTPLRSTVVHLLAHLKIPDLLKRQFTWFIDMMLPAPAQALAFIDSVLNFDWQGAELADSDRAKAAVNHLLANHAVVGHLRKDRELVWTQMNNLDYWNCDIYAKVVRVFLGGFRCKEEVLFILDSKRVDVPDLFHDVLDDFCFPDID